jgi:serine O-acetyltransferase
MTEARKYPIEAAMKVDTAERITLRSTFQEILSDLARYRVTEKRSYPALVVMCPGLIAGVYYRIGKWIWHYDGPLAPLVYLLRPIYICFKRLLEIYSGISLSPQALIGKGLYINHFGSIFVGKVVMGENCNLSHEVTLGVAGRGEKRGLPTLGDRVYVAPGAKVFGKIEIGDDVAIGANAVVTKSIPDCAVVVGAPARIISYNGSFDFVLYPTMDSDPARLANLERSTKTVPSDIRYETDNFHSYSQDVVFVDTIH